MIFTQTYKHINPQEYLNIFSSPNWYLKLQKEFTEFFYNYTGNKQEKSLNWLEKRKEFVKMITESLKENKIALAKSGLNLDSDRKKIDEIIIHHSSTKPTTPISAIEALSLIRLYSPLFSNTNNSVYGQAIWSNHFYNNKPTFIPYHYIIKQDGSFEHILQDDYIGWHCGNWEDNFRSIAICFLDNLEEKSPTENALITAKEIIKKYPNCNILGHREVKFSTTCPGNTFLGKGGWKEKLL